MPLHSLSRQRTLWLLLTLALGLGLWGCGDEAEDDDDAPVAPPGGGEPEAVCDEDLDCDYESGLEICDELGQCVEGDRNNFPDEAQLIEYGDTVQLHIAPADDVDWFRFYGTVGDLFLVTADAEDSESLDTVIVYYDGNGDEIGYNDNYSRVPSVEPNSRFYSAVPSTDLYYFSLEDRRSWANDPSVVVPGSGDDRQYTLSFSQLGSESNPMHVGEPNDQLEDAVVWGVDEYAVNYTAGGTLAPSKDRDWISVPVISSEVLRLYGFPNSGSAGTTRVNVYLEDGESLIQTYDGMNWETETRAWIPVLETGFYVLEVLDAGDSGGFDHWYFLHAAKNNPADMPAVEVEPNETTETAMALGLSFSSGESVAQATYWGRIGSAGDQDRYSLEAESGDVLDVSFASTLHGETTAPQVHLINPGGEAGDLLPWDAAAESPVVSQELSSGTWQVVVSDVDEQASAANRYYEVTITLTRGG